ncbi:MAG TPA: glycerophosphodiester phosphodiesterase family protein [Devosiaceae bacterium]|jgi:glycerophosphoryl diester phosphodiesterase
MNVVPPRYENDIKLSADQVQGHRGASKVAPENTLAAFRAARGQQANWVEFDVSLLGDGTPVVIHDATVDRVATTTGRLQDMVLADLANIDVGSRFDAFYRDERIPTLEAALECFAAFELNGNLEIKRHPHQTSVDELTGAIHEVLSRRPPSVRIGISSFDIEALKSMGKLDSSLELAVLWSKLPDNWRDVLADVPTNVIHLNYKELTFPFLEEATAKGLIVRAWTCNNPQELSQYWQAGLSAVITDEPRFFLSR